MWKIINNKNGEVKLKQTCEMRWYSQGKSISRYESKLKIS